MSTFDTVLWYSGALAWFGFGAVGLLMVGDTAIDFIVTSLWTKREFFAFVSDRLRKRQPLPSPPATEGEPTGAVGGKGEVKP